MPAFWPILRHSEIASVIQNDSSGGPTAQKSCLLYPNIRSSNTEHINCLTIGTNTGGGQAGGEQVFDNLLNRKYSKVKTIKSAFAILSLVKWYLCKIKLLQRLPQTEKDLKLTKMKKSLSVRREQKPFLPTCPITCGLDGRVGCGHKHSVFSDHLFSTVDTNPGWPLVGAEANVTVKDIFKNIKSFNTHACMVM